MSPESHAFQQQQRSHPSIVPHCSHVPGSVAAMFSAVAHVFSSSAFRCSCLRCHLLGMAACLALSIVQCCSRVIEHPWLGWHVPGVALMFLASLSCSWCGSAVPHVSPPQ